MYHARTILLTLWCYCAILVLYQGPTKMRIVGVCWLVKEGCRRENAASWQHQSHQGVFSASTPQAIAGTYRWRTRGRGSRLQGLLLLALMLDVAYDVFCWWIHCYPHVVTFYHAHALDYCSMAPCIAVVLPGVIVYCSSSQSWVRRGFPVAPVGAL